MSPTMEDRLRTHYADRAARETLPGPSADVAVQAARASADDDGGADDGGAGGARVVRLSRPRPAGRRPLWLAVAAVCVVAAGVAGVLLVGGDEGSNVSTDERPVTTTPPDDDREPTPPAPTSTAPDTVPDTTTELPPPNGEPSGPIVSADGVLGTWNGSRWVQWEPGAPPPTGDSYQVVGLGAPITSAVGREGVDCSAEGVPSIDVGLEPGDDPLAAPTPIAVAGVADPRPRPVEVLDPSAGVYREAAAVVLAGQGVDDPAPEVSQVVRGDLDGDGTGEVMVVAERSTGDGLFGAPGDYSVAFLRQVVGGVVETRMLASSVAPTGEGETPVVNWSRVAAFADLNGDGRMEVVLNQRHYEGSSTAVYEVGANGTVEWVLTAGCGA